MLIDCSAKEHVRLEDQARALETVMSGNIFHAPVNEAKVTKVLDIGCGTGYVTDKLARRFPKAEVYGLDLSPVPTLREQRANVQYLRGNVLTQQPTLWTGSAGPVLDQDEAVFDYIFSRLLIAGMTDWHGLLKKEFAMLDSGGYLEHHEVDFTIFGAGGKVAHDGPLEIIKALGIEQHAGTKMRDWFEDAGFVDVVVHKYQLSFGGAHETDPAMKEVGEFWYRDMREAFEASMYGAAQRLGKPIEEAQAEIDKYHALVKPDVGNYTMMYAVYGRKP